MMNTRIALGLIRGRYRRNIRCRGVGVCRRFFSFMLFLLLVEFGLALAPPGLQVRLIGKYGALLSMGEAAYRQPPGLFPALDGSDLFFQVRCDLLPGVEAVII